MFHVKYLSSKYDKQDQQGKAAFKERNPQTTQQQEHKTLIFQGRRF
jgi:hypothetical protein